MFVASASTPASQSSVHTSIQGVCHSSHSPKCQPATQRKEVAQSAPRLHRRWHRTPQYDRIGPSTSGFCTCGYMEVTPCVIDWTAILHVASPASPESKQPTSYASMRNFKLFASR
eukprot:351002-Chlamydomonas_euryale.AAC.6